MKKYKRKAKRSGLKKCEICGKQHQLVTHHIHGRDFENSEKDWNKVDICPNCHDAVHTGNIRILGWFKTPFPELIWEYSKDKVPLDNKFIETPIYSSIT